ncbi:MAG: signal peptidase I [Actinobacteria bacterium]|nr:signal peptidase I [Actinomycetota bacterium]
MQWVLTGGLVLAIYMGWAGAVMVSGESMVPELDNGDIVVFTRDSRYEVGDVAVFNIPEGVGQGQSVIHRIIDGSSETGWTFKGDNRDLPDPWLVRDSDITGKPRFVIAGGVGWLRWAAERSPYVVAGLVTLLVAVFTFPTKDGKGTDSPPPDGQRRRRSKTSPAASAADGKDPVETTAAHAGERPVS